MAKKPTGAQAKQESNKRIATIIASLFIVVLVYVFLHVFFLAPGSVFNMVFRKDVFNYEKKSQLAFTYFDSKSFDKAIPLLQELTKIRPKEPMPYYCIGVSFASTGEPEKAIESLNKAIQLDSKMHQAYGSLASIYVAFGRDSAKKLNRELAADYYRMADKSIEQALKIDSGNKDYLDIQKTITQEMQSLK